MKQAVYWLAAVFGGLAVWSGAAAGPGLVRGLAYGPDPHQRLDLLVPAAKGFPTVGLKTRDLRGVVPMGSIMWNDELEQALTQYGRGRVEEAFGRDPDNRMYTSLDAYLNDWPIRYVRAGLPPFLFLIAEGEQKQPPVLKTNRRFV